jgi:hypothetical protein
VWWANLSQCGDGGEDENGGGKIQWIDLLCSFSVLEKLLSIKVKKKRK